MHQGLDYEVAQVMPQAIATGLFTSLCSINEPSEVFGPSGAPIVGVGARVPVTGLQNIPCTAPPVSEIRIQASEVRSLEEILSLQVRHVLLNGYYQDLLGLGSDDDWQAVIDGIPYIIMGTEFDSQKQMTRMEVKRTQI